MPLIRGLVDYHDRHGPSTNWQYVGFFALDDDKQLIGGTREF